MHFETKIVKGKQALLELIKETVEVPDESKIGHYHTDRNGEFVEYKPRNVVVHSVTAIPGDASISLGGKGDMNTLFHTFSIPMSGRISQDEVTDYVVTFAFYEEEDLNANAPAQPVQGGSDAVVQELRTLHKAVEKNSNILVNVIRAINDSAFANKDYFGAYDIKFPVLARDMIDDIREMLKGNFDDSYATQGNLDDTLEDYNEDGTSKDD